MDDTASRDQFAPFEGDPWARGLRRFAAKARRGAGFDPTTEEPGNPFGGNPFSWGPGQPHRRPPFGGPRFGRFGTFFGPFGPGSGRGPRMRRGDVRAAILALLREQQRNGYQIIQEIERRSSGLWKPSAGSVYPALQQQLQWLSGSKDDAEARAKLAEFSLEGIADKIDVPVYVMHGTDDIVMDIRGAHRFVEALTTKDVTFDVYDAAGSLHCSYDYLSVAAARLADWFTHRL